MSHRVESILSVLLLLFVSAACRAAVGDVYKLVTGVSQLRDGDEVILVSNEYGKAMSRFFNKDNTSLVECGVAVADGGDIVETLNDSVQMLTLRKGGASWKFYDSERGWLSVRTNKVQEMSFEKAEGTNNKTCVADISFDATQNAVIYYKSAPLYRYIRYYSGRRFFSCDQNKLLQSSVQIYRRYRVVESLPLADAAPNSPTIADAFLTHVATVRIGRTFSADGGVYTLCLPFALTADDIGTAFGGGRFFAFSSAEQTGNDSVAFRFREVTATEAGKPYLFRPADGVDVVEPVLADKDITASQPSSVTCKAGTRQYGFIGCFDPFEMPANGCYRFVGSDGKSLVTPNGRGALSALRAYFLLPEAVDDAEAVFGDGGVAYSIVIGDGTTELPKTMVGGTVADVEVYDLCGRRLSVPRRGIVIVNGRKIFYK